MDDYLRVSNNFLKQTLTLANLIINDIISVYAGTVPALAFAAAEPLNCWILFPGNIKSRVRFMTEREIDVDEGRKGGEE